MMLVKPENCVHQSKLQGPANGPMENAVEFLFSPAPKLGEKPEGVDLPLYLSLRWPHWSGGEKRGGGQMDPGGTRGTELVLQKSPQRADGNSC